MLALTKEGSCRLYSWKSGVDHFIEALFCHGESGLHEKLQPFSDQEMEFMERVKICFSFQLSESLVFISRLNTCLFQTGTEELGTKDKVVPDAPACTSSL